MKGISKGYQFALIVVCFSLFCFACGGNQSSDHSGHSHDKETVKEASKAHGPSTAHTSAYICPMHCEGSGSDKEGVCPVCGMDYEPLADHSKNGHTRCNGVTVKIS